jgi:hypothetical protein
MTRTAKDGQQSFHAFTGSICVHDTVTLWGVTRSGPNGTLLSHDIQGLDQRFPKNFGKSRNEKIKVGSRWTTELPFRARAMVKAGATLYLSGGHSVKQLLGEEPGGMLQAFAAADGREQGSAMALKVAPVFDGMAAAQEALFISLTDGSLVCLK